MKRYSLEQRLIVKSITLTATMLLITFSVVQYFTIGWLHAEFDESLLAKSNALVTLTKKFDDGVEFDFADEFMPEFERKTNPEYFQIWLNDGSSLLDHGLSFERSHSLKGQDLPRQEIEGTGLFFTDLILPDGRAGRLVQQNFYPQIPEQADRTPANENSVPLATLVIAREKESLQDLTLLSSLVLAATLLLTIAAIAFFLYRTIHAGFLPLREIKQQLLTISDSDLHQRITIADSPDELSGIIHNFNELMNRLENSFIREKTFSSNAAHELKTPLSELQSLSEYELHWPGGKDQWQEYCANILEVTQEMNQKVESLLLLARSESGNLRLNPVRTDLVKLIHNALGRVKRRFTSAPFIHTALPSEAPVDTSIHEFNIIIDNVLGNAISHSPAETEPEINLVYRSETDFSITVSNPAGELREPDLKFMFERLWRKDPARYSGKHAGLGLNLVVNYSSLLGFKVTPSLDNNIFSIEISSFRDPLSKS